MEAAAGEVAGAVAAVVLVELPRHWAWQWGWGGGTVIVGPADFSALRPEQTQEVKRDLLESNKEEVYAEVQNSAHISPSRRTIRFEKSLRKAKLSNIPPSQRVRLEDERDAD